MRLSLPLAAVLAAILSGMLTACATQKAETPPSPPPQDTTLPYPHAIYVYDFAVAPAEVPGALFMATTFAGVVDDPQTNEKRQVLEKKIADELAVKLVAELQALGLPAVRWAGAPPKNYDSYVINGAFVTIDATEQPGEAVIGLAGSGTELRIWTQMTRIDGAKPMLASAEVGTGATEKPALTGALKADKKASDAALSTGVGIYKSVTNKLRAGTETTAKAIVELLKPKMQEQSWF